MNRASLGNEAYKIQQTGWVAELNPSLFMCACMHHSLWFISVLYPGLYLLERCCLPHSSDAITGFRGASLLFLCAQALLVCFGNPAPTKQTNKLPFAQQVCVATSTSKPALELHFLMFAPAFEGA